MNLLYIFGFFILSIIIILGAIRMWLNEMQKNNQSSTELIEWLKQVSQNVETSSSRVDEKLTRNMEMFNNRLDKAAQVISGVQKSIGEFSEIGRSMKDLQEFLQSPKLRGNIGEEILKELLAQYFPTDVYKLQYSFKSGETVDAIIKTSQGLIPIDSKFPSENFRKMMKTETKEERNKIRKDFEKDVRKHISDISRKYINVAEGTLDYAIMYIPSESVYYEIINSSELYDYASSLRILPVSPMSFYAYMKAILMSFEGQRIEKQAKEILSLLKSIRKDYERTDESLSILNKHITNASNQLPQVNRYFGSLGQKIASSSNLNSPQEKEKLIE